MELPISGALAVELNKASPNFQEVQESFLMELCRSSISLIKPSLLRFTNVPLHSASLRMTSSETIEKRRRWECFRRSPRNG